MPTAKFTDTPLQSHAHPISFNWSSYDSLINAIGNAQVVLIGDGTHGTFEFYAHRAGITRRLIEEKGFTTVAVEADWPDAFRVNRYIQGGGKKATYRSAMLALGDFERFPKWMWKNEVMPPFINFLKAHNERMAGVTSDPTKQVSFYGIDLYSLHRSAEEVVRYLQRVDPEAARTAKSRYNCFERFGTDTTLYGYETQFGLSETCQREVLENFRILLRNHQRYIEEQLAAADRLRGHPAQEQFVAEMNALLVRDAEEYYHTMMQEDTKSWNIRDDHFARVIAEIARHLGPKQDKGKIVVWAHNSHVGDARATDMGMQRGEINIGQRCKELFGIDKVFNIGFLTNRGTVTAAFEWDDPPKLWKMNAPIPQSIEHVFHESTRGDCYVITHRIEDTPDGDTRKVEVHADLTEFLNQPRYQRFIGVIYKPSTEIPSHYTRCKVAEQYDAVVHLKQTRGIRPLEREDVYKGGPAG